MAIETLVKTLPATLQYLEFAGRKISYSFLSPPRARRISIAVFPDGRVVVRVPQATSVTAAQEFTKQKASWILKVLARRRIRLSFEIENVAKGSYHIDRDRAFITARQKVLKWNEIFRFTYRSISIRNQKTRWGSCSKHGTLSFNFRIMHLPQKLQDYLVVHELCHLEELNHSARFWQLVGSAVPNYRTLRQRLRRIR